MRPPTPRASAIASGRRKVQAILTGGGGTMTSMQCAHAGRPEHTRGRSMVSFVWRADVPGRCEGATVQPQLKSMLYSRHLKSNAR